MTVNRRGFFEQVGSGVLGAALVSLLDRDLYGDETSGTAGIAAPKSPDDLRPKPPHGTPRATSVIHLFMNGGPSQMDLFDPKEELERNHGKSYFDKIAGEVENSDAAGALLKGMYKFAQHGQCGMWVSDVLPYLSKCVDDLTLVRGMYTTNLTHEPALYKIHSGQELVGHPSLGSWVSYGLGSENQNLPAYIVLDDPKGLPVNKTYSWQSGYLPPLYQGTRFRSTGSPVLNLKRDFDEPDEVTRLERDLVARLDRIHKQERQYQPQLDARIASYELAARMQLAASDALDLAQETRETQDAYGIGKEPTDSYGRRCLYARRLVERGVRFVQLFIDGQIFDNHTDLASGLKSACERTDQPIAALLNDLKQRGLLDSTLVIWGGEFGRLPIAQLPPDKDERKAGRDHNKNAMVSWMAGGGVKGGFTYGQTDELGLAAVADKVSVPDWHATILHLLGLHHEELFVLRNGLKNKLTGVFEARVVDELLA
ncbi:MAG TPA: DUF1501 domain-containing protein [Planctomycetaceae bacterium]|nr:DUF1501 domain-containing protein [Planctomycetaceae bacterium]